MTNENDYMLRVLAVSDTHNRLNELDPSDSTIFPDADIFVHCGDATNYGRPDEMALFAKDLKKIQEHKNYETILFVPGNHDMCFEQSPTMWKLFLEEKVPNLKVLIGETFEKNGEVFYGLPWVTPAMRWAFSVDELTMKKLVSRIPDETTVLLSHGPCYARLDEAPSYLSERIMEKLGSSFLRRRVDELFNLNLRYHIHGHIHENRGFLLENYGMVANVASQNFTTARMDPPMLFHI